MGDTGGYGGPISQPEGSTLEVNKAELQEALTLLKDMQTRTKQLYRIAFTIIGIVIIVFSIITYVALEQAHARLDQIDKLVHKVESFMYSIDPVIRPSVRRNMSLRAVIEEVLFGSGTKLTEMVNSLISDGKITLNGVDFPIDLSSLLHPIHLPETDKEKRRSYLVRYVRGVPMYLGIGAFGSIGNSSLIVRLGCQRIAREATIPRDIVLTTQWPEKAKISLAILGIDTIPLRVLFPVLMRTKHIDDCAPGVPPTEEPGPEWIQSISLLEHAIYMGLKIRYRIEILP